MSMIGGWPEHKIELVKQFIRDYDELKQRDFVPLEDARGFYRKFQFLLDAINGPLSEPKRLFSVDTTHGLIGLAIEARAFYIVVKDSMQRP